MSEVARHRLDVASAQGTLDLVNADGHRAAFWFRTLAGGFDLGTPEAVKVIVESLMRDGDDSRISRHGNRSVTFQVQICGADLAAVAEGEAALWRVLSGRAEVTWTPPDGFGEPTVFEVLNAALSHRVDDVAEVRVGVKRRLYEVTLECAPWGRSVDQETVVFSTAVATPAVVDDCTSTGSWALDAGGTMTTTTYSGESALALVEATMLRWAGAMPSANYVALDVVAGRTVELVAGTTLPPLLSQPLFNGYVRHWFNTPSSGSLRFRITGASTAYVATLVASSTLPGVLAADVAGSVRTAGSLVLSRSGTSSDRKLQWVQVYADPMLAGGFIPSTAASWQYGWEGTYVAYEALALGAGGEGDVVSVTLDGQTVQSRLDALTAGLPWRPIGELQLGGYKSGLARAAGATSGATVKVNGSTVTTDVRLFRKHEDASLTYLAPGLVNTVEIATPSLDLPQGGIYGDDVALTGPATAPSPEWPLIPAGRMLIWLDAYNVTSSRVVDAELTYYPRWHTYAAK